MAAGLSRADVIWLLFPAVYVLTRFFSAGVPQEHSDPLYYHLAAPKLWAELGRIQLTADHPSFAQATLWETLYGIPQLWFGTTGARAHVVAQLYGQWMHFIWGQLGSLAAAAALLRRLAPDLRQRVGFTLFLAWLCITLPCAEWTGCLAKNEYLILFFALVGVSEALSSRFFVAGLFMGLAYSVKVLAVWTAISLLVLIPPRKWARYAAGALLACAPILARNLIWTGNPFFPMFDASLGPHWISSLWNAHNAGFGGAVRLDPAMLKWVWQKLLEGALPKVLLGLGVVALALEGRRLRSGTEGKRRWVVFLLLQTALTVATLRPAADGRYGICAACLALLFCAAALARLCLSVPASPVFGLKSEHLFFALLPLGLLINSPVDVLYKIPRDYLLGPAERYAERFHPIYGMQRWVNETVAPQDQILFTAEKQQFYLDRPFETVVEMRKWEEILAPILSRDELFARVRGLGYRYLHFSPQTGGYPVALRRYWDQILAAEQGVVYRSPTSLVFDLK